MKNVNNSNFSSNGVSFFFLIYKKIYILYNLDYLLYKNIYIRAFN